MKVLFISIITLIFHTEFQYINKSLFMVPITTVYAQKEKTASLQHLYERKQSKFEKLQ